MLVDPENIDICVKNEVKIRQGESTIINRNRYLPDIQTVITEPFLICHITVISNNINTEALESEEILTLNTEFHRTYLPYTKLPKQIDLFKLRCPEKS